MNQTRLCEASPSACRTFGFVSGSDHAENSKNKYMKLQKENIYIIFMT